MTVRSPVRHLSRPDFFGNRFGFVIDADQYHGNWGGRREKWFTGSLPRLDGDRQPRPEDKQWFYVTPEGDIYHWGSVNSTLRYLWLSLAGLWGTQELGGELVGSLGPTDGPWYYRDPRRLRAQLFQTAVTGPDVLESLTRPAGVLADNPAAAWRRLTGVLLGPDRQQTCIVLTLTEAARRDLHQVLGRGILGRPRGYLYQLGQECSISPDELRLGGPPVDNVAIDEEGSVTLARLSGLSIVLGLGLSLFCFRSVSATLIVFFVGATSSVLSLALVYAMGSHVDSIMMAMPPLVYVLGLAGAAHIINYYHEAVDQGGRVGAAGRAISHGWKPALLCNVTTAIGLGSLYTSELVPIRNFGVFSGIAVLATLSLLFTFLPAALELWPPRRRQIPAASADTPQVTARLLDPFWRRVGSVCIRHHALMSLAWLTVIAAVGYGVTRIQTSVNLLDLFPDDAKIIRDYAWFEEHLGPMVPMEIVLKINKRAMLEPANASSAETLRAGRRRPQGPGETAAASTRLSFLERMEMAARIQQVIEDEFLHKQQGGIGRAISAATFAPVLPDGRAGTLSSARRGATSRMLEGHRQQFVSSDYLRIDPADGAELWRISLRISATKSIDYGRFLSELKRLVEPVVAAQLRGSAFWPRSSRSARAPAARRQGAAARRAPCRAGSTITNSGPGHARGGRLWSSHGRSWPGGARSRPGAGPAGRVRARAADSDLHRNAPAAALDFAGSRAGGDRSAQGAARRMGATSRPAGLCRAGSSLRGRTRVGPARRTALWSMCAITSWIRNEFSRQLSGPGMSQAIQAWPRSTPASFRWCTSPVTRCWAI